MFIIPFFEVFCTYEIFLNKQLGKEKKNHLHVLSVQLFPCSNIQALPAHFVERLELFAEG